ncbi:MAG TPA: hypothetical protein IAA26_14505 [Candidatus Blautia faecipullorum]|nr:hypothetical protein [Candidatus Blautia faecipullorum]
MKKKEDTEEELQDLIREIDAKSSYARKLSSEKKWMTVTEMGDLLGGMPEAVHHDRRQIIFFYQFL